MSEIQIQLQYPDGEIITEQIDSLASLIEFLQNNPHGEYFIQIEGTGYKLEKLGNLPEF